MQSKTFCGTEINHLNICGTKIIYSTKYTRINSTTIGIYGTGWGGAGIEREREREGERIREMRK